MVVAGRQVLDPILSRILPQPPTRPSPTSLTDTTSSLTQSNPTLTETSSTPPTSSALPSSTISTSEIPTTSSVEPSSTIIPVETTSDVSPVTVTAFTTPSSTTPTPSIQAAPANSSNGFLQNKVLSGVVFGVVGLVVLVILLLVATIAIRRSRRRQLVEEAVSFDPTAMGGSELDRSSVEKRRFSLLSSSDHGHNSSATSHVTSSAGFGTSPGAGSSYAPPHVPTQAAYPLHEPYRYPGTAENQYSFSGNVPQQQPWYGGVTSNGPYYNSYPSQPGPGWDRSGTPVASSGRVGSPEGLSYHNYHQTGQLKIANT